MSPGTRDLMCDDEETIFDRNGQDRGDSFTDVASAIFEAQERVVLEEMKNCLSKIVSVGQKRGKT